MCMFGAPTLIVKSAPTIRPRKTQGRENGNDPCAARLWLERLTCRIQLSVLGLSFFLDSSLHWLVDSLFLRSVDSSFPCALNSSFPYFIASSFPLSTLLVLSFHPFLVQSKVSLIPLFFVSSLLSFIDSSFR